jgi:hypothetical protein
MKLTVKEALEDIEGYSKAIMDVAPGFLSRMPKDITDGRELMSLLTFGTKAEIEAEGVLLWEQYPSGRQAALKIEQVALSLMGDRRLKKQMEEPCPLTEAWKKSGVDMPPPEVISAMREILGIRSKDKVEITGESLVDDDHGLPMDCFMALQKVLPGIKVVQRKVISCPGLPVEIAQATLDIALIKARAIGLM